MPRRVRITQHLNREQLAMERVGKTAEERLRWVVDFAYRDLGRLQPEELIALGYDLRAAATPPVGWLVERPAAPVEVDALRSVQETLATGLRTLLLEDRHWRQAIVRQQSGWRLRGSNNARLVRLTAPDARDAVFTVVTAAGTETDAFVYGVAELIVRAGRHLRACRRCHTPFVAPRRQVLYCSRTCGDAFRNVAKLAKRTPKTTRKKKGAAR
jgi:hypothetical protein